MAATILLIDDEPRLRQLLARILQLEGYTVLEAENARAGLKTLERAPVQLVISDVKLPDKNGIELTAHIKQLYPATEIIVLTAYGTIADGVTAIKNGAFDYITKGDDNDRIIPLVSRAVEKGSAGCMNARPDPMGPLNPMGSLKGKPRVFATLPTISSVLRRGFKPITKLA